jgi:hypothetical protein
MMPCSMCLTKMSTPNWWRADEMDKILSSMTVVLLFHRPTCSIKFILLQRDWDTTMTGRSTLALGSMPTKPRSAYRKFLMMLTKS